MRRPVKYLFRIFLFAGISFAAYAIFADLPAPTRDTVVALPVPAAAK